MSCFVYSENMFFTIHWVVEKHIHRPHSKFPTFVFESGMYVTKVERCYLQQGFCFTDTHGENTGADCKFWSYIYKCSEYNSQIINLFSVLPYVSLYFICSPLFIGWWRPESQPFQVFLLYQGTVGLSGYTWVWVTKVFNNNKC